MKPVFPRYSIYSVPERDSSLERLGSAFLGRDIYTGTILPQPALGGVALDEMFPLTRDARRYGLHATLKSPFLLKPGVTEQELVQAAEHFTKARRPLPVPSLTVDRIGSFFALTMHPQNEAEADAAENISLMAREAVSFFDRFRAPPSEEELDRRREKGLTSRQEKYLLRWGYPYVFDEFRFHITLTDGVREPGLAGALETGLRRYMAPAFKENWIEAVFICRNDPDGNFTVLHRAEFSTASHATH